MEDPDDVYSVSYGQPELGVDQSVMNSFNYQAQKLGILGTTVLVSSGDNGIQSTVDEGNYTCIGYFSEFPTSSQYVTSVGATMVSFLKLI
jgi:tripeptidyl-peptidase-1